MENIYDDQLLPTNFEQIAKAYSKSLKDKGFVFVRLEEEEFNLLLSEVAVILCKMQACLVRLDKILDAKLLKERIKEAKHILQCTFGTSANHRFRCTQDENTTFLTLVALENLLTIKLMLLSVKSGEFEACNSIITSISGIFAESFPCEGFVVE